MIDSIDKEFLWSSFLFWENHAINIIIRISLLRWHLIFSTSYLFTPQQDYGLGSVKINQIEVLIWPLRVVGHTWRHTLAIYSYQWLLIDIDKLKADILVLIAHISCCDLLFCYEKNTENLRFQPKCGVKTIAEQRLQSIGFRLAKIVLCLNSQPFEVF